MNHQSIIKIFCLAVSLSSCGAVVEESNLAAQADSRGCATDVLAGVGEVSRDVDENSVLTLVARDRASLVYLVSVYPQYSDGSSSQEFPPETFGALAEGSTQKCTIKKVSKLNARNCADLAMRAVEFATESPFPTIGIRRPQASIVSEASRSDIRSYQIRVVWRAFGRDESPGLIYAVEAKGHERECRITSIARRSEN